MRKIAFLNGKGGVGKSTLACNFSCIAASKGEKVLLIDADIQQSSVKFREVRAALNVPQFSAVSILTPTIHKDINNYTNFDYIFMDTGGKVSPPFKSAIIGADVIILPLKPGQYDVWSSQETLDIINEIRMTMPNIKVYGLLNMLMPNTTLGKEIIDMKKDIAERYDIEFLENDMTGRTSIGESSGEGLSIMEYRGKDNKGKFKEIDHKARNEMENIYNEVMKKINGTSR